MTKVNPKNGTFFFSRDIFKYDISFHWSQNTKIFK